jgi:hypothetical protein
VEEHRILSHDQMSMKDHLLTEAGQICHGSRSNYHLIADTTDVQNNSCGSEPGQCSA